MSRVIHVGVDLMGADFDPLHLLESLCSAQLPEEIHLTLLGLPSVFEGRHSPSPRIAFLSTSQFISQDEAPIAALRKKNNSSISVGIQLIREEKLHALISAGNTGALMASAKMQLPMIGPIKRPALLALLPTRGQDLAVLDVGANATCTPEQLLQFALIGTAHQKARGIPLPRTGLLNIGTEVSKGTSLLKKTHQLLSSIPQHVMTFVGNVEPRDAFHGDLDLLITDGFTGNVFLKTAEGIARVILEQISSHPLHNRLHYAEYPGALLCGIDGLIMKCHGSALPSNIIHSILRAARLHEHHFIQQIKELLEKERHIR